MGYDVEAIRRKLKQSQAGKYTDPDEFKPAKAKDSIDPIKYRFYILPPLAQGSNLKSGEVKQEMDHFFIQHGNHWVNDRPHACPRVWDNSDCQICSFGFDLLREEREEDKRRSIIKQWMPTTYQAVNIYFTHWKGNPEDLRGKVKWYNAPKTLFDHWTSCLMREDCGDKDDPKAFGVFFDESEAFVYQLEVLKQGKQNSYKTSHFLPNGGVGMPMVKNEDGSVNSKAAEALLRLRHNLWDKLEVPDSVKIRKLYNVMVEGDDEDDGGFDSDETVTSTSEASKPQADDDVVDRMVESQKSEEAASSLSDEIPLQDEAMPKNEEPSNDDDDDESSEISALLSQLEDDD